MTIGDICMGKEAIMTIDCKRYSENIEDIIDLLARSGWKYYGAEKKIEYLPLGDGDDYNWQKNSISAEKLRKLIGKKQVNNEVVGLVMYKENSDEGITILAKNTKEITFCLDINRKTVSNNREAITDVGWYFTNILQRLDEKGCSADYIKFEEYID